MVPKIAGYRAAAFGLRSISFLEASQQTSDDKSQKPSKLLLSRKRPDDPCKDYIPWSGQFPAPPQEIWDPLNCESELARAKDPLPDVEREFYVRDLTAINSLEEEALPDDERKLVRESRLHPGGITYGVSKKLDNIIFKLENLRGVLKLLPHALHLWEAYGLHFEKAKKPKDKAYLENTIKKYCPPHSST